MLHGRSQHSVKAAFCAHRAPELAVDVVLESDACGHADQHRASAARQHASAQALRDASSAADETPSEFLLSLGGLNIAFALMR
jgi:hypothetical protein